MLDLKTIDPATVQAGEELDELIAREWMGWEGREYGGCHYGYDHLGTTRYFSGQDRDGRWSPSTNPAHAGEARRKAKLSYVFVDFAKKAAYPRVWVDGDDIGYGAYVTFAEADNDPGRAEALAVCRAIVGAVKARKDADRTIPS